MSNEMNFEGIRLAYVHLSVTTPRGSGLPAAPALRALPAGDTPAARDAVRGRWDRAGQHLPDGRSAELAA